MTNQEKKQELWAKLAPKFTHLENHCTIELIGIENDTIYFHPTFKIQDGVFIRTQCDVGGNESFYATTFTSEQDKIYYISIYDEYIENIIVSWQQNKQIILLALDTLQKVNSHVDKMRNYTNEYIGNLLVGNSIFELSNDFINEIKTTTKIIELLQSKPQNICS